MADEFQSGICSGNWWSSATSESSPCSTVINDVRSFGWPNDMGDIKARYSDESVSVSSSSMITSFGLSSPSLDWNQSLLRNSGTSENNLKSMLEEDLNSRSNYQQESGIEYVPVQKEWSPKNYSDGSEDSSVNAFTQLNQALGLDQNSLNSSKPCFPVVSSTTLLPDLFESRPQPEQHHYVTREMNYSPPMNYQMNLNELSPSWQKFPQFVKPSSPKQRSSNQLHFSNNTHFWNASAAAAMNDVGSSFSLSPQTQFLPSNFEEKSSCSNMAVKMNTEDVQEKKSSETTFKRPRIETPSPLPTFKVRKEKLGDRITALQQLVSPFGKTDTASVLYEAIEYIRFLHEQVHVLSTPYMKNAAPMQYQQNSDKSKNSEAGPKQDLRSRGLCLVPVSSTYPVTTATTADFWNPTFGGTYR